MGKEERQNSNYTIMDNEGTGRVQISNEVITIIAGLAATETKGVASMAGNIANEMVSRMGIKSLSRGVKVTVDNGIINVDLTLNLDYGYSVPKTCQKVQEKVKSAIENMTGLTVENINIQIANVMMESGK